jgi:bifunctional UDP-N-acetylglucosamine pyrophosphorylase/glucosamine-1-phosphate N-acetyltransferase
MATVIIMAGGNGKRMNSELPKVLHLVEGVPMIVRIMREAHRFGSPRILVVVGKGRDAIETVIQESCETAIVNKITYVFQSVPKGTGHAIMCCLPHLHMNERVLILSGDTPYIKAETLSLMSQCSKRTYGAFNKICLMTMHTDDPTGYGRVIEDDKGNVRIVEHRDCSDRELEEKRVNCGIYFTTGRILMMRLPFLSNANAQSEYYLPDIVKGINDDVDIELCEITDNIKYQVMGVNTEMELVQLVKSANAQDDDTPF